MGPWLPLIHQLLQGMIEQYKEPYDVALGLHACGNATDFVLLSAEKHRAAYVVCPCCVGKLKFSTAGGSSFSVHHTTWQVKPPGIKETLVPWLRCHSCGASCTRRQSRHLPLPASRMPSFTSADADAALPHQSRLLPLQPSPSASATSGIDARGGGGGGGGAPSRRHFSSLLCCLHHRPMQIIPYIPDTSNHSPLFTRDR